MKQENLYQEGEAFAEIVASVYKAKCDEHRLLLLQNYAAQEGAPSARWAMALLARGPKEQCVKILYNLASRNKLEVNSQIKIDQLLCQLVGKDWSHSSQRRALLTRWLDTKSDYILFREACLRIRDARDVDLDVRVFTDVVSAAVAKTDQMTDAKIIRLGEVLRFSGAWFGEDKKAARVFLEKMKNIAKSDYLRKDIDDGLKQLSPR